MNRHQERANVLLGQGRYDLAAGEYRLALADDPDDAHLHALLGLCLVETEQYDSATQEAREAIRLGPDQPLGHYVLARTLAGRNRMDEAEAAVREAIRLDPDDPDHRALLAGIELDRKHWQLALAAAEEGLAIDPEHVGCNNLRAMALVKLGRGDEAEAALADTLALDPDNPFSHANQGWALLHRGQPREALEHFREALRLDPSLEFARAGIVEAMKARNPVYGLLLRYFLWMARLSGTAQWAIILGLYFGQRFLRAFARNNPAWDPWVTPILVLYTIFVMTSWLAVPLFNLMLRLDRFGRHALSREEVIASNWVGGLLVPAVVSLVGWLATDSSVWFLAMVYFGLLLLPVAGIFGTERGWPRRAMTLYTIALALAGPVFVVLVLLGEGDASLAVFLAFLWGSFLSGFVANGLAMVQPRR